MTTLDNSTLNPPAPTPGDNSGVAAPPPDSSTPAVPPTEVAGEAPPPQYLDLDQFGDHLVKLKVDGQDMDVPLKKARDGLMMQEAFTKRTQELAEERRLLQQAQAVVDALDSNPVETIKQLAEAYDLDLDAGLQPIQRAPEEQRVRQMQSQLAQQQEQLQRQRVEMEVAALRQIDPNVDVSEVARYTTANGHTSLMNGYKAMQFDQMQTRQKADAEAEARRKAAAAAASAVQGGASTQRGATGSAPINSIRDAWMAAKRTHNAP